MGSMAAVYERMTRHLYLPLIYTTYHGLFGLLPLPILVPN